ncbi:MAG TPA: winged helix-turn-helix transcriptional regulator [Xanthobacteraceae bacterium]|nr:winged helix-turn-helix transcriptional regulator [Xanthobacteraceae bacterium]
MATSPSKPVDAEKTRIMLGLLESVERGDAHSQRLLASELGVALGLVNAYLRRCVSKGLVKVRQAPARRYAYYLTPRGFSEKSRLTVEYLSYSLSHFRRARQDCTAALQAAGARGYGRVAFLGVSELAEIAAICALESGVTVVAVVDPAAQSERFVGVPVWSTIDGGAPLDAVLVTDINDTYRTIEAAVARLGAERVFVPALLGATPARDGGAG